MAKQKKKKISNAQKTAQAILKLNAAIQGTTYPGQPIPGILVPPMPQYGSSIPMAMQSQAIANTIQATQPPPQSQSGSFRTSKSEWSGYGYNQDVVHPPSELDIKWQKERLDEQRKLYLDAFKAVQDWEARENERREEYNALIQGQRPGSVYMSPEEIEYNKRMASGVIPGTGSVVAAVAERKPEVPDYEKAFSGTLPTRTVLGHGVHGNKGESESFALAGSTKPVSPGGGGGPDRRPDMPIVYFNSTGGRFQKSVLDAGVEWVTGKNCPIDQIYNQITEQKSILYKGTLDDQTGWPNAPNNKFKTAIIKFIEANLSKSSVKNFFGKHQGNLNIQLDKLYYKTPDNKYIVKKTDQNNKDTFVVVSKLTDSEANGGVPLLNDANWNAVMQYCQNQVRDFYNENRGLLNIHSKKYEYNSGTNHMFDESAIRTLASLIFYDLLGLIKYQEK